MMTNEIIAAIDAEIQKLQLVKGDTSRNGILCTLTTAADRWGVQGLAINLPQTQTSQAQLSVLRALLGRRIADGMKLPQCLQ